MEKNGGDSFFCVVGFKKFSASFITNIVNEKISDVETGLNIIRQEAILKKILKIIMISFQLIYRIILQRSH